jgi:biotin transport system permease protein
VSQAPSPPSVHAPSPVHAAPAGVKLLGLLSSSTVLFFVHRPAALACCFAVVVALFGLARLGWRAVVGPLRASALVLLLLFAVQALQGAWAAGLEAVLRLATLLLLATLVTRTTRTTELLEALQRVLAPLARFGVSPARLSLMLSLTLRFIPVLLSQLEEVREAQRARGLHRSFVAVLVPLLVRTLRTADALTEALEARGHDTEESPSA